MSEKHVEHMSAETKGPGARNWKKRFIRELIRYWINVLYLAVFFGAFAWYRRFVLAGYGIEYLHYGGAIVEAFILGKVILIGEALGLSRGLENKPLIYPTLHKAVVFTLFVAIFAVVEEIVAAMLRGKGVAGGLDELRGKGKAEILARCLVMFLAFIPFFAFKELGIRLGEGTLGRLFFRKNVVVPRMAS
jgi:hypothetical protein